MTGLLPVAEAMRMPTFPAIARLRQHFTDPPPTDAELLDRFTTSRDDAAFAELVRRHGSAVLAVCRRVTGNRDDADDAFQAAFLVLARKADRVRSGSSLGGWLYGVAVRAARKAVARTARRRSWEATAAELPEVPDRPPSSDPETVRMVLEEVARLSDAYRSAVVLCELEGRSRTAAARELGIAEGTLSSRLAAARMRLARRFRDRGLVPAVLAAVAGSAACPVLAADVARLAGASASPAPRVEQLSETVMRSVILSKWKLVSVAAVLAAVGLVVNASERPITDNPKTASTLVQPTPKAAEPTPLPKGPNKLLVWRKDELLTLDPDGTNEKVISKKAGITPDRFALSPNGKQVAFTTLSGPPNDLGGGRSRTVLHVIGVEDQKEQAFEVPAFSFAWSRNGDLLAYTGFPPTVDGKLTARHEIINVQTKWRVELKLPSDHYITDWSRDGQHLVTTRIWPNAGVFLMKQDGSEHQSLTEKRLPAGHYGLLGRLSPDGKRLLFTVVMPKEKDEFGGAKREVAILDCVTGKVTPLADAPLNGQILFYCWSPDGKRIAYTWVVNNGAKPGDMAVKEVEAQLVVCDADGKNAKTILSEKGVVVPINGVDWR